MCACTCAHTHTYTQREFLTSCEIGPQMETGKKTCVSSYALPYYLNLFYLSTYFYFRLSLCPPASLLCSLSCAFLPPPPFISFVPDEFHSLLPWNCPLCRQGRPAVALTDGFARGTMESTLHVEGLTTRWHSTKRSAHFLALMRNQIG